VTSSTTLYNAAFAGWIGAKLAGACSVLSVLEVFARQWLELPGMSPVSGRLHRFFEWAVLRMPFDHFACISEWTRSRLLSLGHVPQERTSVVYPAVDYAFWSRERFTPASLRRTLGLPEDCFVYLYFGRPGVSKGVEYLIDAAAPVATELPNSRLLLILGNDPPAQVRRIRKRIDELGLAEHVVIAPRCRVRRYRAGCSPRTALSCRRSPKGSGTPLWKPPRSGARSLRRAVMRWKKSFPTARRSCR
jgi:glycosyltransferase involved in cell wall biosynthesis